MRWACSTAEMPERERLAYWVDAVCDTFIHVDCEPKPDCPLCGEIISLSVGKLRIGTVSSTAQVITRSPRQIARDDADVFNIGVQLSGCAVMSQDGRQVSLRPGDLVLHDSSRPWQLTFDGTFSQMVLQVPRVDLTYRLGSLEHLGALRIDGAVGIGAMLSQLLRVLPSQFEKIPTGAHTWFAENLLDLTATAFLAQQELAPPPSADLALARVKLWIETHLTEDLSAPRIASECHLSTRHLNRLFRRDQTTVMRYVWKRRLARCHHDLIDPSMHSRSITELAFAAGFNDLSHFSRSYKQRYGRAPREARHMLDNTSAPVHSTRHPPFSGQSPARSRRRCPSGGSPLELRVMTRD
jgi:AraC family transcriptional activator of tynA and feaB